MSQTDFIAKLKAGDRALLSELYTKHMDRVVSWICLNNGTKDDGYDIFQDTLEAIILKAYKANEFSEENIAGYIMQIAKNKWIDQLRRKKTFDKVRKGFSDRLEDEYNIETSYISIEDEQEKQAILKSTFNQLTEICQQLLEMLLKERPTEDIVKELDMTNANTMYRRKHACMKSWKSYIEATGFNNED